MSKILALGTAFLAHGRGKKSVTHNLRTPEIREILLKLATSSDVIVEYSQIVARELYKTFEGMSDLDRKVRYRWRRTSFRKRPLE